jgi:hypothetical protein
LPVRYKEFVSREFVNDHPDWWFVFGDNCARTGYGGQAREMRNCINSIGVRTKNLPTYGVNAFFDDKHFDHFKFLIDEDLKVVDEKLNLGYTVVIPSDGLGTGRAALAEKAPKLFAYLQQRLKEICDGREEIFLREEQGLDRFGTE